MGLGMGWAAANAALHPAVTRVTVVERDPVIIAMIAAQGIFGQLPAAAAAKLEVVEGDALEFVPALPADRLLADIWQPLITPGRVEEVQRMAAHCQATRVYFWGQEMEIARHLRGAGLAFDADGIAAAVSALGLPLLGPELPDYPDRIRRADAQWLRDRAS